MLAPVDEDQVHLGNANSDDDAWPFGEPGNPQGDDDASWSQWRPDDSGSR